MPPLPACRRKASSPSTGATRSSPRPASPTPAKSNTSPPAGQSRVDPMTAGLGETLGHAGRRAGAERPKLLGSLNVRRCLAALDHLIAVAREECRGRLSKKDLPLDLCLPRGILEREHDGVSEASPLPLRRHHHRTQ